MKSIFLVMPCLWVCFSGIVAMAQRGTIASCPDDSIRSWLSLYEVPGAAIGILEDGEIKTLGYYGNIRPGVPVSASTIWNVASLTKPVTAVTMMNVINAGQLGLDEPIFPYFIDPDIKDEPWARELTPRIFLSHQTGFKNWRRMEPDHKLRFNFEPGHGYHYSGLGYEYLRHAVEVKLGMNLQQLGELYVFARAGMRQTHFGWSDNLDSNRFAWGYAASGKRYDFRYADINAADWLVTSLDDYCRFGLFVMGGEGISQKLFLEVTRIQVRMDTIAAHHENGMGLGWEVVRGLPHQEYALSHNGSDDGVATFVLLLPVSKRGIVIFTNGDGGDKFIAAVVKGAHIDLAPALAGSLKEFQ
jgi:CubicO group peptidase (beta-lactamase class C family)